MVLLISSEAEFNIAWYCGSTASSKASRSAGISKSEIVSNNKQEIIFSHGSQIKAIASNESAGRSEALSLLIFDEAAFIDKIDDIWTSAQQTLATGGDCIALSTPNGVGNWFHKMWVDAESGGEFNTIKLHWTVHPDRDQAWRDKQTSSMTIWVKGDQFRAVHPRSYG